MTVASGSDCSARSESRGGEGRVAVPNIPNEVVPVQPGAFEPVAGPREVSGFEQFGNGGGTEYFRVSVLSTTTMRSWDADEQR